MKRLVSMFMLFAVAAFAPLSFAVTVQVITSNNATINSNTDIAVLEYASVTSGLSGFDPAYVNLPEGNNGQVLEIKVTGTIGNHNIIILPSGSDQLESDTGLDTMATSQGSARRLFFKSGKWNYLTYM